MVVRYCVGAGNGAPFFCTSSRCSCLLSYLFNLPFIYPLILPCFSDSWNLIQALCIIPLYSLFLLVKLTLFFLFGRVLLNLQCTFLGNVNLCSNIRALLHGMCVCTISRLLPILLLFSLEMPYIPICCHHLVQFCYVLYCI